MKTIKSDYLRLACCQMNCTVGGLEGNAGKIIEFIERAEKDSSDIIVFPELSITGYPPEDLLHKPKFIEDNLKALSEIRKHVKDSLVIAGFVDRRGGDLYNAAALIYNREIKGVYHKVLLPNYGVFDEKRYFKPGKGPLIFSFNGTTCGITICEDIWHEDGPVKAMVSEGVSLVLNINASPYYAGKIKDREAIICKQARKNKFDIAYVNLIGGQDELVFDGQSMIVDSKGDIISRAEAFNEDLMILDMPVRREKKKRVKTIFDLRKDIPVKSAILPARKISPLESVQEIYRALMLGLSDYTRKNGFNQVVIALSGGVDSALVAAIAVDSLGRENVTGIFMPTRYSSKESLEDVEGLAGNFGIKLLNISIEQLFKMYLIILEPHFAGSNRDITEENLQARIRANIIMAFSNKFGSLVLTTGNKSEMSTGYATLYGDMAGGLAVIKDVPKTMVYKLAKYRNTAKELIPERILTKEPTAELKMGQKDRDTLPVYETLDPILKAYVEEDSYLNQIVKLGYEEETTKKVIALVDKSEYKRRQSAPGIKITPKAFGRDRRMPITNGYKG